MGVVPTALKKTVMAGLTDVLGLFGMPTATAEAIYAQMIEKRKSEGLEILFSELRRGNLKAVNQHELISVIARFQRDAIEGVAKQNLYLLAQVIRGMSCKQKLTAPSFSKYADALSSLTEDEITVLGYMAKKEGFYASYNKSWPVGLTGDQTDMILQALLRTGLVYFEQGVDAKYESLDRGAAPEVHTDYWINYSFTPFMKEILKYVDAVIFFREPKHMDAV